MKEGECPNCKRVREFEEGLVMKVCYVCQEPMVILEDLKGGKGK